MLIRVFVCVCLSLSISLPSSLSLSVSLCIPVQTHKLSEQEESEIRECFALFDRDKDGKIKVEELGLIMRSLGRAPTELEVKEYQKSVDKGDGHFNIDGISR